MAMSMEQLFVLELMSAAECTRHPVVDLPNRSICKEQVAVRALSLLPFEQHGFCSRDPWKFAQALTPIAPVTMALVPLDRSVESLDKWQLQGIANRKQLQPRYSNF